MSEQQRAFTKLYKILANLYHSEAEARRIAAESNLDTIRITFSGNAINTWNAILLQAQNQRKTEDLRAISTAEYGENEELSNAWHNYIVTVEEKGTNKPFSLSPNQNAGRPLIWISLVAILLISIGILSPFLISKLVSPTATATAIAAISPTERKPLATFTATPEATETPVSLGVVLVSPTFTPVPLTDTPIFFSPTSELPTETPTNSPTETPTDVPPSPTAPLPPDGAYSIAMSFKIALGTSDGIVVARASESLSGLERHYSVVYRISQTVDGYLQVNIYDGVLRSCNTVSSGIPLRMNDNNWLIVDVNVEDGGGPGILLNATKASRNDGYHDRCGLVLDNGTPVKTPPRETSQVGQLCTFSSTLSLEKRELLFASSSGRCP